MSQNDFKREVWISKTLIDRLDRYLTIFRETNAGRAATVGLRGPGPAQDITVVYYATGTAGETNAAPDDPPILANAQGNTLRSTLASHLTAPHLTCNTIGGGFDWVT